MRDLNRLKALAISGKSLKTIIVPDYYPYSFVNDQGEPDGFSVDIAKAVAKVLGMTLKIGVDTWEHARGALENGTIDFLPMMAASDLRRQWFDFSVPHTIAYDAAFVRRGTPRIGSLDDLSGKTVIVMNRDAAHDVISATPSSDTIKLILVDSLPDGLRLLASGKGDVAIMPKLVGLLLVKKLGIANVEESPVRIETYNRPFSFAVKKGNTALVEAFDHGLAIVKADGQYHDIYEKWFGVLAPPGLPWKLVLKYVVAFVGTSALVGIALLVWSLSLRKRVALRTQDLESEILVRKETEAALRESDARHRAVFENAAVGIDLVDSDGGFLQVNGCFTEMLGYTQDELLNLTFFDISHPDDVEVSRINHEKMVRGETESYRFEKRYVRKDGDVLWADVSVSPVRGPEGVHLTTVGVIADITDRKRTEQALRESEQQYRSLFEDSIDGVYSVLRDGTITDANAAFCELFGYMAAEMIGKDIRELYLDPADRPKFQKEIEKHGFVKDYEIKFRKRDGTEVDCLLSASVHLVKDKGIRGYRGIVRDLTARKALQRQLLQAQKMEAVGTLAGGIAHDFNNLLQVVSGYSELVLADEDLADHLKEHVERILLAERDGADLVKRLLTFSRKTETKPLYLNLNQRIIQTSKFLKRTIPKMVDIEMILAEDLASVHADPNQMDQVLMNLAVNARDAMPDGGHLTIETSNVFLDEEFTQTHPGSMPGEYVLLSVTDTGYGMDKETLEHMFEPFYTTKETGRGTGLGLAMVYGIVKQHGGYNACWSEPGQGTTFKIYLPAVIPETQHDKPVITAVPQGGTETILLVDDEEFIRDLGKRILERSGYKVITASNGNEALDLYKREMERVSLVILDFIMPEMSGTQCLEKLLKIDPQVKALIASGFTVTGDAKNLLDAKAKGLVPKPFDIRDLLHSVRDVLDGP